MRATWVRDGQDWVLLCFQMAASDGNGSVILCFLWVYERLGCEFSLPSRILII
jgi:hypothetical protein